PRAAYWRSRALTQSSQDGVRYTVTTNRYRVPRPYAFQVVTIKGYVDRVVIVAADQTSELCSKCNYPLRLPKPRLSPNANLGRPLPDAYCVYLGTRDLGRSHFTIAKTRYPPAKGFGQHHDHRHLGSHPLSHVSFAA